MAEHVCSGGAEPDIIEDKVISMNKPYFIFRYISMLDTRKVSFNFDKFQQAFIDANDAEWMWKFATHFKGADIELIRKHIHTAEGIQSFIEAFDRDFPICTVNN